MSTPVKNYKGKKHCQLLQLLYIGSYPFMFRLEFSEKILPNFLSIIVKNPQILYAFCTICNYSCQEKQVVTNFMYFVHFFWSWYGFTTKCAMQERGTLLLNQETMNSTSTPVLGLILLLLVFWESSLTWNKDFPWKLTTTTWVAVSEMNRLQNFKNFLANTKVASFISTN